MAVSICDIARRLSVSPATVSRALSRRDDRLISEATRQRVLAAAGEMGYRPNSIARALVTGRTHNIGLLVPAVGERTDPHFAQMLEAVEAEAHALGYRLVLSGDLEGILGEGRVDGVVVLGLRATEYARVLHDSPAVFVFSAREPAVNHVCWSDAEGFSRATHYLADLGHRHIAALFAEQPDMDPPLLKAAGFREAVRERGVQAAEWRGTDAEDQFENAYLLTQEGLRRDDRPTAIICRNDVLAFGVLRAVRDAGLRVPDDVSVVGYNDTVLARYADPPLTSVRTPIAAAGEIAVRQLAAIIERGAPGFPGVMLPTSLTARRTCAPPAAFPLG